MYKGRRVLLIAPAYNEEGKIGEVGRRAPRDIVDTVLVVDDGSTDRTADVAAKEGADVIRLGGLLGVGAAIRRLVDDASLARVMGQAGQQHSNAHYAWPAVAEQMEELYESLRS